ncbi:30S ribosomal protein S20 [Candidatus Dependentiae bacterium]|nr:30S ribosomal protein S20 [Candidatus Dependentiae bacterium]MCC7415120.1 30S ribosomal protein S20 [Campylobacterota bacterium]
MANIKSSKKRARQGIVKRERNLARKSALKTAVKKVLTAIAAGDVAAAQASFKEAQAKIARARGKGLLHANTAARKVSRLAQRIAATAK